MKSKAYKLFSIIGEYSLCGLLFSLAISNAMVEIFVGLAFFGFIGRKIIKPDFKYLKFWPNIFLVLFLLFSALSLFNSGLYLHKSINALFGKWMQYLGIYIIVQDSIYDQKIIKRGLLLFLFGASLAIISGLSQYYLGFEFLRNRGIGVVNGGVYAITSSFNHYNAFGGYLVVVLPLVIALLSTVNSSVQKVILLIFSLFSTMAIMLTFSRGSWLAVAVAFIFLSIFSKNNLKWSLPVFLVVIVMFFFPVFHERLFFIFKAGGDSDRFKYWLTAWKMINAHPFLGIGLGTFMANFTKYIHNLDPYISPSYAHNCYLQIWAETGIFSLASFMAFIGGLGCIGIKTFLASRDFLLIGLLAGVLGFLVHSFFESNLYSLRLVILFWVWIGLVVARLRKSELVNVC